MSSMILPFGLPVIGSAIATSLLGVVGFTATLLFGEGVVDGRLWKVVWLLVLLMFVSLAFSGVGLVLVGAPEAIAS